MTFTPNTTVGEIAVQLPQSTRLFERMRIDYCCGGDKPLAEACERAGIDVQNLLTMLENVSGPQPTSRDFQQTTASELISHILETHHAYTKSEMDRLEQLVMKVVTAHGSNHPELLGVRDLLQQLFADLKPHMFKEEQILFPYIVQLEAARQQRRTPPFAPFGTINNPIRMMTMEHDTAGDMLRDLRKLTSDYAVPADACVSYRTLYEAIEAFEQDLHQHIHLENNVLFPQAMELENSMN